MRPLADEIRPQTLEEVAGQKHLLGEGALLRRLIENGDQRLGITVCGSKAILTIRYTGNRALRICRDFSMRLQWERIRLCMLR